jgi:hypothetical protein
MLAAVSLHTCRLVSFYGSSPIASFSLLHCCASEGALPLSNSISDNPLFRTVPSMVLVLVVLTVGVPVRPI